MPLARSQGKHGQYTLRVVGHQGPTIERQKQLHRHKGRAFVAIDKGMIARQAIAVRRRQGCEVWRLVSSQVQGAVHGRFKQALIAHATGAPVFDELLLVHRQHDLAVQPNQLACPSAHLANSRNTCRRSFMILRAALICVSKSAS